MCKHSCFKGVQGNMRMLVDAEHSYFQPAIDALTIALQQKFNKEEAVIMNTYQCYLTVPPPAPPPPSAPPCLPTFPSTS